jgi:hypothetical protein
MLKMAEGAGMKTTQYQNIPGLAQPAGAYKRIRRPWIGVIAVAVLFLAAWALVAF